MMRALGGFSLRSILRAILAIGLLLGSGAGEWTPALAQALESCCCGAMPSVKDSCPCPKPEGNRAPSNGPCVKGAASVASLVARATQFQRKFEPRPEPTGWAEGPVVLASVGARATARGRDPDLGRHLARLETFRI